MENELNVSERWRQWRQRLDLDEYNSRWDRLEADGVNHLVSDGLLVSGFSVAEADRLKRYDGWCSSAASEVEDRLATWDGQPYIEPAKYVVSVHRRPTCVAS